MTGQELHDLYDDMVLIAGKPLSETSWDILASEVTKKEKRNNRDTIPVLTSDK